MLLELILNPLFGFCNFLVSLIPNISTVDNNLGQTFMEYIGIGLHFFGTVPFLLIISNVLMWVAVDLTWSIVEWTYKKIPGVN